MSLLKGKYVENDTLDGDKILLENDQWLRAKNATGDGVVNLIKISGDNEVNLPSGSKIDGSEILTSANVVSTFEIQGNWNADTNTPTLVSGENDTGATYPLYIVNVAGSTVIDGQSDWQVGDKIYFGNGQWYKADNNDAIVSVNNKVGVVTLNSDDISEGASNLYYTSGRFNSDFSGKNSDDLSEGSSNLYFSEARVRSSVLTGYSVGSNTAISASDSILGAFEKVQGQIDALSTAATNAKVEVITISATDIANGYITLEESPTTVLSVSPKGGLVAEPTADYSINNDELSWSGDLASIIDEGDKLIVSYLY